MRMEIFEFTFLGFHPNVPLATYRYFIQDIHFDCHGIYSVTCALYFNEISIKLDFVLTED